VNTVGLISASVKAPNPRPITERISGNGPAVDPRLTVFAHGFRSRLSFMAFARDGLQPPGPTIPSGIDLRRSCLIISACVEGLYRPGNDPHRIVRASTVRPGNHQRPCQRSHPPGVERLPSVAQTSLFAGRPSSIRMEPFRNWSMCPAPRPRPEQRTTTCDVQKSIRAAARPRQVNPQLGTYRNT
jgi:hypothetical protein